MVKRSRGRVDCVASLVESSSTKERGNYGPKTVSMTVVYGCSVESITHVSLDSSVYSRHTYANTEPRNAVGIVEREARERKREAERYTGTHRLSLS